MFPLAASLFLRGVALPRPANWEALFLDADLAVDVDPGNRTLLGSVNNFLAPLLNLVSADGSDFFFVVAVAAGFFVPTPGIDGHFNHDEPFAAAGLAAGLVCGFGLLFGFSSLASGLSFDSENPSPAALPTPAVSATASASFRIVKLFTVSVSVEMLAGRVAPRRRFCVATATANEGGGIFPKSLRCAQSIFTKKQLSADAFHRHEHKPSRDRSRNRG
jgi:hypothetical protein